MYVEITLNPVVEVWLQANWPWTLVALIIGVWYCVAFLVVRFSRCFYGVGDEWGDRAFYWLLSPILFPLEVFSWVGIGNLLFGKGPES